MVLCLMTLIFVLQVRCGRMDLHECLICIALCSISMMCPTISNRAMRQYEDMKNRHITTSVKYAHITSTMCGRDLIVGHLVVVGWIHIILTNPLANDDLYIIKLNDWNVVTSILKVESMLWMCCISLIKSSFDMSMYKKKLPPLQWVHNLATETKAIGND